MNKKTFTPSKNGLSQDWHLVDAKGEILGKLAATVSDILTGKNKAIFTPNINVGDKVVVINAEKIEVTRGKETKKVYHYVTGFPGGLKTQKYEDLKNKHPEEIIRRAISGMLPKNKLRKERLANLYIYRDEKHPHQGQINKNA
ncbi:50S ribosomal protein L13 [candidate division WWE3 bacterium RBG_19FT_COMBO_34_6]|uniref:Large ribosomal subunit protein uL13 n=1 Tax=candidate division WWE3 bacterium RBG_19FT_COMBO_34_6 TaxID=1802612 RepID=A0A1F4UQM0_UNCKA|nr:MAG: 50S ribosomal protein L13 [candidate division WWE3 bacterium RBG_19FT_COMBO_34_6]